MRVAHYLTRTSALAAVALVLLCSQEVKSVTLRANITPAQQVPAIATDSFEVQTAAQTESQSGSASESEAEFLGGLLGGGSKKPPPPLHEIGGTDINLVSANQSSSGQA